MSTHSVDIIEIETVLPHENAERLEIVLVNGWQAVVLKGDFKPGDKAVYIQPDYVVPTTRPEFAFLAKGDSTEHRMRAIKLRGVPSYGLLIKVPDDLAALPVGANVMEDMGIIRYTPPLTVAGADQLAREKWPDIPTPVFDLESYQNYPDVIKPGEMVHVTEKIHGTNARYLFHKGVFYMGSRTRWLKPDSEHVWKVAADNVPSIQRWCEANPDTTLYGEVYGRVQSLKYGLTQQVTFAGFAAFSSRGWTNRADLVASGIPMAPELYVGPFDIEICKRLAEEDSAISTAPKGHMREGVVIVPVDERHDYTVGRVALKHISNRYWLSDSE